MRLFSRHLSQAAWYSREKKVEYQHIVVCGAFVGRSLLGWRHNTEIIHAETRSIAAYPEADRLVIYRFNRADTLRLPRASAPCSKCAEAILASGIKKVEFYSVLGPVMCKAKHVIPYRVR